MKRPDVGAYADEINVEEEAEETMVEGLDGTLTKDEAADELLAPEFDGGTLRKAKHGEYNSNRRRTREQEQLTEGWQRVWMSLLRWKRW